MIGKRWLTVVVTLAVFAGVGRFAATLHGARDRPVFENIAAARANHSAAEPRIAADARPAGSRLRWRRWRSRSSSPAHVARRGDAWAAYVMQDLVRRASLDGEVVAALLPSEGPGLAWIADYADCASLFPADSKTMGIRLHVSLSTSALSLVEAEPYWVDGPALSSQAMACVARILPSHRVVPRVSGLEVDPFDGAFDVTIPSPLSMVDSPAREEAVEEAVGEATL